MKGYSEHQLFELGFKRQTLINEPSSNSSLYQIEQALLRGSNSQIQQEEAVVSVEPNFNSNVEITLSSTVDREVLEHFVDSFEYPRRIECGRTLYFGFTKNGMRSGFGVYTTEIGDQYSGIWRNDKLYGVGMLRLRNGATYTGDFKASKLRGYVEFVSSSGVSHMGEMDNYIFLKQRPVIIKTESQTIEVFLDLDFDTRLQSFSGVGRFISSTNLIQYEGEISDYNQAGLGITIKDSMICQGFKKNKMLNGYCEIYYRDGTKYCGCFKDNKKYGLGCFMSKDRIINVSQYENNVKNGCCISRKLQFCSSEIIAYECFLHGFRCAKIENRLPILKYVEEYYPEQLEYASMDFDKLTQKLSEFTPLSSSNCLIS